uniref:Uncharacterized protein n=1 Tax=Rhizophora mucronata TaxID=61149 RepID=A0A2P2QPK3_RHIMU
MQLLVCFWGHGQPVMKKEKVENFAPARHQVTKHCSHCHKLRPLFTLHP